jgi:deoxyribodipyrimidine photo-lyase
MDWAAGLRSTWRPGEAGALQALERFLDSRLSRYQLGRDLPDRDSTSRLSPYLHFGEIGPHQLWFALRRRIESAEPGSGVSRSIEVLRRELGWREFAAYLLYHLPYLSDHSLDVDFDELHWRTSDADARAWKQGRWSAGSGRPVAGALRKTLPSPACAPCAIAVGSSR